MATETGKRPVGRPRISIEERIMRGTLKVKHAVPTGRGRYGRFEPVDEADRRAKLRAAKHRH